MFTCDKWKLTGLTDLLEIIISQHVIHSGDFFYEYFIWVQETEYKGVLQRMNFAW